jgi:hypothetical protein
MVFNQPARIFLQIYLSANRQRATRKHPLANLETEIRTNVFVKIILKV